MQLSPLKLSGKSILLIQVVTSKKAHLAFICLGIFSWLLLATTAAAKAPLKFGPEFEFQRAHITPTKLPLRRQIFSEAVRSFAKYLYHDENLPWQWVEENQKRLRYDQHIKFEGILDFKAKPAHWPDSPVKVYIDTANLNDYAPNAWDSSPQLNIVFSDASYVEVFYTVDDVVLEAHTNPMSLDEARRFAPVIHDAIFALPEKVAIKVAENGGGHIHVDLMQILKRAGETNPKAGLWALRNFIVDFYSHSQFVTYALRAHPTWALMLGMTSQERVLWFKKSMESIDKAIETEAISTLDEALSFIQEHFRPLNALLPISLVTGDEYDHLAFPPDRGIYKPAIQFSKRLNTMEIRALASQSSYQEFIDLAQLFNGRIDYLIELNHPLPLPDWDEIRIQPGEFKHKKISQKTLEHVATQLISYVSGAMVHVPEHVRLGTKKRLMLLFEKRLMRFSCRS